MISEALVKDKGTLNVTGDPAKSWSLAVLSVATSIDASAVGLSPGAIGSTILVPVPVIGIVAAGFALTGMFLGRQIGLR